MPSSPERNEANPSMAMELVPRVGRLEADVSQLKVDVSDLKADVWQLKIDMAEIKAKIDASFPHFATKADLLQLEVRMIRWMIGSWIAMAGLVVAAVRYVPHA
jgi:hypothetical protein